MKKIAVLFDNYGNPGQPFLTDWFERVRAMDGVEVRGFTDSNHPHAKRQVTALKPVGIERIRRFIRSRILARNEKVPYTFLPLIDFRPHVLHILNAQQFLSYRTVIGALRPRVIVSFRGYETSVRPSADPAWKEQLMAIYQHADSLHFVSDFLKNEAIALGAPPDKCVVLRRSVDTAFFKPAAKRDNEYIQLLAVGRLTWQKGYPVLLESLSTLIKKGLPCKLTIVGTGNEEDALKEKSKSLGIEQHITFAGHLDRDALRTMYQRADVFVQASVSDALPNSVLEAGASGLPVISTRTGGIPEAVVDGITAILVKPGDPKELSDAMEKVITDVSFRTLMGKSGRDFIEREFNGQAEKSKWNKYYSDISI